MLLMGGSMLSPGLISYHRSTRTASRQPSSDKFPSITIAPFARAMVYVSPRSDVCAEAEDAEAVIAAITAVLRMHRADISSLRRDMSLRSFESTRGSVLAD